MAGKPRRRAMASGHSFYDLIVLRTNPLQEKACGLTAGVSGFWAGWENASEQKKLEARKLLLEVADSQKSAARFVRRRVFA